MKNQEFIEQLNQVQDLMNKEKYKDALILLEKLKMLEKTEDFEYSLAHRLYQLDSNTQSLYNQQTILNNLQKISKKGKSISFDELNKIIKENNDLDLSNDILRREIELLILRDFLNCKIERDKIII
jgi:hypothetical protein